MINLSDTPKMPLDSADTRQPDFSRLEALIGSAGLARLRAARVAVVGLGGVGSYTVEALARSAIGTLVLIDGDLVAPTDINRQLPATLPNLGRFKTDVLTERIALINPACMVIAHPIFLNAGNIGDLLAGPLDYIVDAIDQVAVKVDLAVFCHERGIPLISCLGMGNKLDPTQIKLSDLSETSVCPLARVMRRELRQRGIPTLKVVYSREQPRKTGGPPASCAFVPPAAGLVLAGAVVRGLIGSTEAQHRF